MKNNKIKLLLITSVFVDRGVERIVIFLSHFLPKDTYEVRIVSLRNLAPYADFLNKNTDTRVDIIGMKNNIDIFALVRLYHYFREFKPDIINFHSFRAALWGRIIAKFAKVPVVLYSVHNKWGGTFHRFLDRAVSGLTDAIIPFSVAVREFIIEREHIKETCVVNPIYIGIDTDKFSNVDHNDIDSLRKDLGIGKDQNVIGFIGSIAEQKGLKYLIESVRILKPDFENICCIIIGDGPEETHLKNLIHTYDLHDNFIFLGQRHDTPALLHLMKIFVLPSLWEGLPQVVIEAMAASRPVIATDVDGTPEIISHKKDGWLVPPANPHELSKAIKTLLTDDKLRVTLARNGFITARDKFNLKRMVDNYDSLYQTYLKRQS